MDSFSDSSRCDLDSVASTDSLLFIADEFRLRHVFTPDVSNAELLKRVACLELENERLRIDLENSRIELTAGIAANQSLKEKITDLYIQAQAALQEKSKLENALKNTNSQLKVAENSKKWHQVQIHELQANKNGLQVEIETHRRLVRQKHDVALTLIAACKQANLDYIELSRKLRNERQELKAEVERLKTKTISDHEASEPLNSFQTRISSDLSTKLETTEDELCDTRVQLKTIEQRLLYSEIEKTSLEDALAKHRELISDMEVNVRLCEMEKDEAKNDLNTVQIELDKSKSANSVLQTTLFNCKHEHDQVEQAIVQLKSQLDKMIAQYKLIKTRNAELESKLELLDEMRNENQALRSRSLAANSSLLKKIRNSKRKIRSLEKELGGLHSSKQLFELRLKTDTSLQECLRRALERNKELGKRLRLISMSNTLDESIDEGYGDGYAQILGMDLPSPRPLDPHLMRSISKALTSGRNILSPVETELENLRHKLQTFQDEQNTKLSDPGRLSPVSPRNNARSVA